jgi:hypothetical protein
VLGGIGTASSIISVSVTEAGPLIDDRLRGAQLVDAYYGLFQVIIFPPNLCCNSFFFFVKWD